MLQPLPLPRTSLARKLAETSLTTVAVLSLLAQLAEVLLLLSVPPAQLPARLAALEAYEDAVLLGGLGLLALGVALALGLAWRWHRRERQTGPSEAGARWHARLQGLIRYWLAFQIATYGFAKLFQTQFSTPNYLLDRPLWSISGAGLTWYYFGYSYTFVVILGLLQIGGAALLLFRRTSLLGVLVLLPVLTNIVFINVFYNIGLGALLNSVLFVLGLSFLLGLEWPRLRAVLFALTSALPTVRLGGAGPKNALRLAMLVVPALMVAALKHQEPPATPLDGVWRVDAMRQNGRPVVPDSCGTGGWTRLYFAGWQGCVARFHPYKYEPQRELRGNYTYDPARRQLHAALQARNTPRLQSAPDSLVATVLLTDARHARLTGRLGTAPVELTLSRLHD